MERRGFLIAGLAGLLAACGGKKPPGPAVLKVDVQGLPGMNPVPDGSDRAVTLLLLRLKDAATFKTADLFALQTDSAGTLGADLIGMDRLVVPAPAPSTVSKTVTFEPEATQLGIVAILRDPGRAWRVATPVAPGMAATATLTLDTAGIALKVA